VLSVVGRKEVSVDVEWKPDTVLRRKRGAEDAGYGVLCRYCDAYVERTLVFDATRVSFL
jgi:hypothetical protein